MDSTAALILLGAGFVATVVLEGLLVAFARRRGLLAVPNARSFHTVATPAIGGVGFALPILVFLAFQSLAQPTPSGLLAGGAVLALLGLVDDLRETGRGVRMAAQLLALGLVFWTLQPGWPWWAYAPVGVLLLWQINLYNFMDGIDGILATQTLFFCLAAQLLTGGVPGWEGALLWLTAGAMLAFLVYNWTPARIFMGDTGSVFLGLLIGVAVVQLVAQYGVPLLACTILLTAFWFDASYTLCVRIATRQPFTEPHRSHLYQKLAARIGTLWTMLGFSALCVLWLLPLAVAAASFGDSLVLGAAFQGLALLPVAVAAWRLRAGLPE